MSHQTLSHDEWKQVPKPDLKGEVHLLLDGLQSIENAGLIFRSAAALGIDYLIFHQPVFQWKASTLKKLSRSASEQMTYDITRRWEEIEKILSSPGQIVALEYTNRSKSLYEANFDLPLLLIAGNEQRGIRPQILELVSEAIHIPLSGQQSSINVSCAVTAALVEVNRHRI